MKTYDLYAIGNALVDAEYEVSDTQLQVMGVDKRHMTLIDAARRSELLGHLDTATARRTGGGSAGNTVVALAQLGGQAFYSCRVADDELGAFYTQDLIANGVATNLTRSLPAPGQTGSCLVMVTPDAERSMSTFLGATAELDHTALHQQDIAKSKIYYMEGYLAASPTGLQAALQGRQMAQDAGVALATTLSDVSMINFCRPGLDAIIDQGLDYLFCNEEEAQVWCGTQDLQVICQHFSQLARTVCLTRGPHGCVVLEGKKQTSVPAVLVQALDTNGAGDMFAGAFLYAVTHGHSHAQAAWLANQAAGQVVSQYGNRLTREILARISNHAEERRLVDGARCNGK
ncbi:MAG: adenosine kinase [Rhodoferax sp.]|uniref:adenosine kinase n=1 Tax=Rhodoferax sp. TaxID=50421 RepID=UPI0013FFE72F|nr:adenosine kinase [Rhodoferax sp.]NDP37609.1 adenosine kinase [Rhodoferax sp.]